MSPVNAFSTFFCVSVAMVMVFAFSVFSASSNSDRMCPWICIVFVNL